MAEDKRENTVPESTTDNNNDDSEVSDNKRPYFASDGGGTGHTSDVVDDIKDRYNNLQNRKASSQNSKPADNKPGQGQNTNNTFSDKNNALKDRLNRAKANVNNAVNGDRNGHTSDVVDDIKDKYNDRKSRLNDLKGKNGGDDKKTGIGENGANKSSFGKIAQALKQRGNNGNGGQQSGGSQGKTSDEIDGIKGKAKKYAKAAAKAMMGDEAGAASELAAKGNDGGGSFVLSIVSILSATLVLALPIFLTLCFMVFIGMFKQIIGFVEAILELFGLTTDSTDAQKKFMEFTANEEYKKIAECFDGIASSAYNDLMSNWEQSMRLCMSGYSAGVSDIRRRGQRTSADDAEVFNEDINVWGSSLYLQNFDISRLNAASATPQDADQKAQEWREDAEMYERVTSYTYDIGAGHQEAVGSYADNWDPTIDYNALYPDGPKVVTIDESTQDKVSGDYLTGRESFFNLSLSENALVDQCNNGQISDLVYLVSAYNISRCELPITSSGSWFTATFHSYKWDIEGSLNGDRIHQAIMEMFPDDYSNTSFDDIIDVVSGVLDEGNRLISYLASFVGVDVDGIMGRFYQYNAYLEQLGAYQRRVYQYVRKIDVDNPGSMGPQSSEITKDECSGDGSLIWLNKPYGREYTINNSITIDQKISSDANKMPEYSLYNNRAFSKEYQTPTVTYNTASHYPSQTINSNIDAENYADMNASYDDNALSYYRNYLTADILPLDNTGRQRVISQNNGSISLYAGKVYNPPAYTGFPSEEDAANEYGETELRSAIGDNAIFSINGFFNISYSYAYGGELASIALSHEAAASGAYTLSSKTPTGTPTSDMYYTIDSQGAFSSDSKSVYFVYLPAARYGTKNKVQSNDGKMYNPTHSILCLLSTTEGITPDEMSRSISDTGVSRNYNPDDYQNTYYGIFNWTYYYSNLYVTPATGPDNGTFTILKVDDLESAYNSFTDGFKITIGDTNTTLTKEKTMSFDMTARASLYYEYNCYYMRAYGSPIDVDGIIFFLFKIGEYTNVDGDSKRYYENIEDFKTEAYTDLNGERHEKGESIKVSDIEFSDGNSYDQITDIWGNVNGAQMQPVFDNVTLNKYTCGNYGSGRTCEGSEKDIYWMKNTEEGTCDGGCGAGIAKNDRFNIGFLDMDEGVDECYVVKGEFAFMHGKYNEEGECIGYTYYTVGEKINDDVKELQADIEQAMLDAESSRQYSAGDFNWISTFNGRIGSRTKGTLTGFSADDSRKVWSDACEAIDKSCADRYKKTNYIDISDADDLSTYTLGKYAVSGKDAYDLLRNKLDDGSYQYYFIINNFDDKYREDVLMQSSPNTAPTTASLMYTIWRDYAPDCDKSNPFFLKDESAWTSGTIPYLAEDEAGKERERVEFKKALEVLLESEVCRTAQSKWFAYKVNVCLEAANQIFIDNDAPMNEGMLIYLAAMPFVLSGTFYEDYAMGDTQMLNARNANHEYSIVYDIIFYENGMSTNLEATLRALNVRLATMTAQTRDNNYMSDVYNTLINDLGYDAEYKAEKNT